MGLEMFSLQVGRGLLRAVKWGRASELTRFAADFGNERVRRVQTGTLMISTVAGTGVAGYSGDNGFVARVRARIGSDSTVIPRRRPATLATFSSILGISVSSSGSIFIADNGNSRIRVVSPGGTVSTFAGTGVGGYSGDGSPATLAQLYDPRGCDTGSDSTTYVADTGAVGQWSIRGPLS